jgi:hypothetical protein
MLEIRGHLTEAVNFGSPLFACEKVSGNRPLLLWNGDHLLRNLVLPKGPERAEPICEMTQMDVGSGHCPPTRPTKAISQPPSLRCRSQRVVDLNRPHLGQNKRYPAAISLGLFEARLTF